MTENIYVKKRKRRRRVAVLGSVSLIGVTILSLVAFLGRFVGQFTVSLNSGDVSLSLATKADFSDSTTYLKIGDIPKFEASTYSSLPMDNKAAFTSSKLDSEDTDYLYGANRDSDNNVVSLDYFKYTFYLKNTGATVADYTFSVSLLDQIRSSSGKSILDAIRVMLFETDVTEDSTSPSTTSGKIYAEKSKTNTVISEDGTTTDQEYVSVSLSKASDTFPCYGFAENFVSEDTAISYQVHNFAKGNIKRYTLVTWIEGFDPDIDGVSASDFMNSSVKIGVRIDATQSEQIQ